MVFSDSTNIQYGTTDLNRNLNRWYETALGWVLLYCGEWQVNGDVATTNLVAGQREYLLPTDILLLNDVYIKSNATGADYVKAKQRDLVGINLYNENYRPQIPEFDLLDNSIFIYLPDDSITSVSGGLKIVYQKDLTELSGSTDTPNLAEPFKRLLSAGAALDFCVANDLNIKAKKYSNMIYGDPTVKGDNGLKGDLLNFYANRAVTKPIVIGFQKKNFI
jgi:hypothetical protein